MSEKITHRAEGLPVKIRSEKLRKLAREFLLRSRDSQQLRSSPDPGKPADELEIAKSGITALPAQREAEKEKKKNV